jgi:AcrR family transcriptional regulator
MATTRAGARARPGNEADKARRRAQIMAAAKRVFARKGYHATTVADVAKAARMSYGSVYWYFNSKDELFHALMAAEREALRDHIATALTESAGADAEALFAASVRATFEFFESDRAAVRLLFRDASALGGKFERHLFAIYEEFIDEIEAFIVDGQRRGAVVDAPPRMVAFSVAALIGQLAQRRLATDDGVAAAEVADFVVQLLLQGLLPR